MKGSFLQTFGGVATDVGFLSPGGFGSIFGNRYPFRSAFSLGLNRAFEITPQHRIMLSGRWLQEFSISGTMLSPDVEYMMFKHFVVGLGADFIAAGAGVASNGGGGYVAGMSGYDRVRASLRYEL